MASANSIQDLAALINSQFAQLNEKFDKLDAKVDSIAQRVASLEIAKQAFAYSPHNNLDSDENENDNADELSETSGSFVMNNNSFLNHNSSSSLSSGAAANASQQQLLALHNDNPLKDSVTVSFNNFEDYEFEFESVFFNPKTRPLFLQYCESEHVTENTNFLQQVEKYKQSPSEDKAKHIIETFIAVGAPQELNIVAKVRDAIAQRLLQRSNNNTPSANMFDEAQNAVMIMLKMDTFSRFIRSEPWRKFVRLVDASVLQQIGVKKSLLKLSKIGKSDLEDLVFTDKHIEFAQSILKDYTHWELVKASKKMTSYTSNRNFMTDEAIAAHGFMLAVKGVGNTLNYPARFCLEALSDTRFLADMEVNLNKDFVEYYPANPSKKQYATSIVYCKTAKSLFSSARDLCVAVTVIYDKQECRYIRIIRSCIHPKHPITNSYLRITALVVEVFQEISVFQSKYMRVTLLNPRGMFESTQGKGASKLFKLGIKLVLSAAWKSLEKSIDEAAKHANANNYKDCVKVMQTLKDNVTNNLSVV